MKWHSQIGQDEWVASQLPDVTDGVCIDIGAGHWEKISNSLYFDRLGWKVLAVDIDPQHVAGWLHHRPQSVFVVGDATRLDYRSLLRQFPRVIEYLSIDLEPPEQSYIALKRVVESGHVFRCVTFEHDEYRKIGTQDHARALMRDHGYRWIQSVRNQDDYFVWTGDD